MGRQDYETETETETVIVTHAIQAGCVRENPDSGPDGVGVRTDGIAYTLEARAEVQAVMTLAIRGRDGEPTLEVREDGTANAVLTPNGGRGGIGVGAVAISANQRGELRERAVHGSLSASKSAKQFDGVMVPAIGWSEELTASIELAGTVQRGGDGGRHEGVMTPSMAVRRLTPRECERLQGFPDDYTKISDKTADGPRYKALGNSMAVPVMRWIGERIQMVEAIR
jgi:DNA (cytosine-5)-methyltransferase 1